MAVFNFGSSTVTNAPKECKVCHGDYDKDVKSPRILPCSHSLCTVCIDELIRIDEKQCPFCRKDFQSARAKDVTINRGILEFMKYLEDCEVIEKGGASGPTKQIKTFKKETMKNNNLLNANCQEAQRKIENVLKSNDKLMATLQQRKTMIKSTVLPKITELANQHDLKIDEMANINEKLRIQQTEAKENQKQLQIMKEKLSGCHANTFKEAAQVMDETEEANTTIDAWVKNFNSTISDETLGLQKREKEVEAMEKKIEIFMKVLSSDCYAV